jgi:uncharacterized membrane protein YkvA (DUF1232 family)
MAETSLKVSFELSARDVGYFREQLKLARTDREEDDEQEIIKNTVKMVEIAQAAAPPEFVVVRLQHLEQLVEMIRDDDWRLEGRDRVRVLDALAYFAKEEDLIPDRIPGIGYLDDAIMVELVTRELQHEIKAYEDFCEFRNRDVKDEDKLGSRRDALQARMRRRRRRQSNDRRSAPAKKAFRLW